ncbi:MAG: MerR family transcriptional regulator [Erysipelotrichaceae bacterium]|nr:MerR family transcriptional regulator [Erysipelotrichaceae bacterium]
MLKIGDFSRIGQVSIRMLRHYDQIGLLKPDLIDESTGYRSYSIDQLPRLNRIIFLKDMGFSLIEVSHLVDEHLSLDKMKAMMIKRKQDLLLEINEAHLNLNSVSERLNAIENESKLPDYDIVIKRSEGLVIASLRSIVPNLKDMASYCASMYGNLYKTLGELKINPSGPELTLYYNQEYSEENLDMEVAVGLKADERELILLRKSDLKLRELPSEETVASLLYSGPFEGMELAIVELLKWIALNGWEINGELRELHLMGKAHPEETCVPKAVIEFQMPIRKSDNKA